MKGTPIMVTGLVLSTQCGPIASVLLDFWQADEEGIYDNQGFRLRGHQFADSAGGYRLETIMPGPYSGRTRHIHVKLQAPNLPVLTTQLYFPGEARNNRDFLFDPRLLLTSEAGTGAQRFRFGFVLDLS